jgi:predicted O-methyltransferase YrrM
VVVERAPHVDAYGFDLWVADYAGMPNPGEAFVRAEMTRLGHRGQLVLVSGDSKTTLPAFLAENPDLYFDLVTIDGDHSAEGARADLLNALPRVRLGGVLVMDDVAHPQHAYLMDCWTECVAADSDFDTAVYTELGYGVACAVRVASPSL